VSELTTSESPHGGTERFEAVAEITSKKERLRSQREWIDRGLGTKERVSDYFGVRTDNVSDDVVGNDVDYTDVGERNDMVVWKVVSKGVRKGVKWSNAGPSGTGQIEDWGRSTITKKRASNFLVVRTGYEERAEAVDRAEAGLGNKSKGDWKKRVQGIRHDNKKRVSDFLFVRTGVDERAQESVEKNEQQGSGAKYIGNTIGDVTEKKKDGREGRSGMICRAEEGVEKNEQQGSGAKYIGNTIGDVTEKKEDGRVFPGKKGGSGMICGKYIGDAIEERFGVPQDALCNTVFEEDVWVFRGLLVGDLGMIFCLLRDAFEKKHELWGCPKTKRREGHVEA
jgi:hypothetical protein